MGRFFCDVLSMYGAASGQMLNMEESEVCFGKDVIGGVRDDVANFLGV